MGKITVILANVCCCICFMAMNGCSKDLPLDMKRTQLVLKSDSVVMEASLTIPRRSEGGFVMLRDGSILSVYSRFTGGVGDHSYAVLSARISSNRGLTWGEEYDLILKEGAWNVMSVSLLRLKNGSIALFYLIKNSENDCYPVMRVSTDEGKTWSASRPCQAPGQGYFVMNNSRAVQLRSGRIMLPIAQHAFVNSQLQQNGALFCLYSDDNGRTWHKSDYVPKPANVITQEPGLIELKDERTLMYIRTASGCQYYAYSTDGGLSWSYAEPSSLVSAQSPATIVRNPYNRLLFAVWNASATGERTPLCMAVSVDEGRTWVNEVAIENNPGLWYCYPSVIFPDKNTVLLSYSAGKKENWGFGAFMFSRIRISSLWP